MIDIQDIRLIARLQTGKPEVYAELYDRYGPRLMSYGLRLCGDRSDAEDLVQETILAAWNGRAGYQRKVKLLSWLLGILSRRWREKGRRPRLSTVSLSTDEGEADIPASGPCLESGVIDRLTIDAAIATLDVPFREALLLVHSQGLTYREAADVLGEPAGTVKWRVSEALKRVQRQLAICEEEIDGLQQASARAIS